MSFNFFCRGFSLEKQFVCWARIIYATTYLTRKLCGSRSVAAWKHHLELHLHRLTLPMTSLFSLSTSKNKFDVILAAIQSTRPPGPSPPIIEDRPCSALSMMKTVSTAEIMKIVSSSLAKHVWFTHPCSADLAGEATLPLLTDTIASRRIIITCVFSDALDQSNMRSFVQGSRNRLRRLT